VAKRCARSRARKARPARARAGWSRSAHMSLRCSTQRFRGDEWRTDSRASAARALSVDVSMTSIRQLSGTAVHVVGTPRCASLALRRVRVPDPPRALAGRRAVGLDGSDPPDGKGSSRPSERERLCRAWSGGRRAQPAPAAKQPPRVGMPRPGGGAGGAAPGGASLPECTCENGCHPIHGSHTVGSSPSVREVAPHETREARVEPSCSRVYCDDPARRKPLRAWPR
jgi:hypothetical protein